MPRGALKDVPKLERAESAAGLRISAAIHGRCWDMSIAIAVRRVGRYGDGAGDERCAYPAHDGMSPTGRATREQQEAGEHCFHDSHASTQASRDTTPEIQDVNCAVMLSEMHCRKVFRDVPLMLFGGVSIR
jgi:hypothetical protein